ncbi:hypothetical protein Tco_0718610 [Tanacetum coccineum]
MDDPNMTMEEYIKLEEEKARRRGRVFNWQTDTYRKIRVDDDLHDLSYVDAEFPAIVINDAFAPYDTLPYKSQVNMAPLPPHEQRHPFLRYQGLEYSDADIADFEERLERIYGREIHMVHVVDFLGMPKLMRDVLFARIRIEHRDDAGVISESERMILGKGGLHDYWRDISTDGDFLGPPPSYTLIRDPMLRLCHWMMAHSIARRSQALEKSRAHISGGQFVARLPKHFGLLTTEILGELTVIALELPIINMERQPDAVAGAPAVAEDAPATDEGDQAVLALGILKDVGSLHGLVERSMTDQGRFSTWMMSCMTQLMDASGLTYQAFDRTFQGSSPAVFQRRTRHSRIRISLTHDSSYPYLLIKPDSKFSTIVPEYVTEPSKIFTLDAGIGKRDDFKCVEAEEKSNLKTSL